MARFLSWIWAAAPFLWKLLKEISWDLFLGLPALVLIARGIYLIHPPSAMIFLGAALGAVYLKHELSR